MRHWFLPRTPDVLATLRDQAETTLGGIVAFVAWSGGDESRALVVRDAEHAADEHRRTLQTELRNAFSLPLDAENIYDLSERLDAVMNGAKDAVREAEVMSMPPDAHMHTMARHIEAGARQLVEAFAALTVDDDRALGAADRAIKAQRDLEHTYRAAMSEAMAIEDLRELFGRRELYRRYARIGDAIAFVGERVWYAVVKQS